MSLFTLAQSVLLLQDCLDRENLTHGSLRVIGSQQLQEAWPDGPSARTYRHWLAGNGEQATWPNQQELYDKLYATIQFPWPESAAKEAAEYKRRYLTHDQDNLTFSACFTMQHMVRNLLRRPINTSPSAPDWGTHVVTYAFLRNSIFLQLQKVTTAPERQTIKESEEYQAYRKVSARLIALVDALPQETHGLWASFLRFNIGQNLLAAAWNCTEPAHRVNLSEENRWRNFLDELLEYLDRAPRDVIAVHNALAWVSVFDLTEYFEELHERYQTANGKAPNWLDPQEFDADFSNFKRWLAGLLTPAA